MGAQLLGNLQWGLSRAAEGVQEEEDGLVDQIACDLSELGRTRRALEEAKREWLLALNRLSEQQCQCLLQLKRC
jgi:hypothetical protein